MASLVITSGQLKGRRIEVSRELVIGRENVDVEIDDAELSRRHFAVRPVAGGLEVEDLGSRNGTRVDGTRIDGPTRVKHGAVVTVGMTTLSVDAAEEAASAGATRVHVSQGTVVQQSPSRSQRPAEAAPPRRREAAPAAPAPAAKSSSQPVAQPFGRYVAQGSSRRRKAATRLWLPQLLTYAAVIGTAAGLVAYFAGH